MTFYDSAPENILHSATCMVVVKHAVTAEEATAGSVTMMVETRTVKFRDVVNGKVRPVDVQVGLYLKTGEEQNINYALLAKGRGVANGIIADYDALPEPITTDEYYDKDEIDAKLAEKADADDLTNHTSDTDIHVTVADKTAWDSKADLNDIGSATITITQGGVSKGAFSVNAIENVTIDINDGAQADWTETDDQSPAYIQHKPSIYTQSETDALLSSKADVATTIAGYGITDAYTKTEVDSKISSVYRYKGSVSAYSDLPTEDQEVGDVYNVATADAEHGIKAGDNVAWNGSAWDTLAGEIDLSGYLEKPATGSASQVLTKTSNGHVWADAPTELPSGGSAGQVLTKTSSSVEWADVEDDVDYLCLELVEFTDTGSSTDGIWVQKYNASNEIELEYSFDKKTWQDVVFGTVITKVVGAKVYFRGDNTVFSDASGTYTIKCLNAKTKATGNVMSLLSKDCSKTTVPAYGFRNLFWGSDLITAPKLPATNVGTCGYQAMFKNNSYLTQAPELPATVLGTGAYKEMFENDPLTSAPNLPAMTVPESAYENMFQGCDRLVEPQAILPATTLGTTCYKRMFRNCTALRHAPVLPATDMATQCYTDMFAGCSQLEAVPALPATNLATECYGGMFGDCTSLTSLPENLLPATNLATGCYQWMFYACTSLKFACNLPATTLQHACYSWMYGACTALLDSGNIAATTLATAGMEHLFDGCTNLCRVKIPNMTSWNTSCTTEWLKGLDGYQRAFVCHWALDTSSRSISTIPQGWIACRSAYAADGMVNKWNLNANNFTFSPCSTEQDWIYVYGVVTLNAIALPNGYVGSAQAYINLPADSGDITAGTGIDFVDTPRKGYLSHVLVTWEGLGNAKLRVMWETAL